MKNTFVLAGAGIGCAHIAESVSSENTVNKAAVIQFPSGASMTLPDGVECQGNGNQLQFNIASDPVAIHMFEYESDLIEAIKISKKKICPDECRAPAQTITPPEPSWDAIHIEIYGPDAADEYLQLIAKKKGVLYGL